MANTYNGRWIAAWNTLFVLIFGGVLSLPMFDAEWRKVFANIVGILPGLWCGVFGFLYAQRWRAARPADFWGWTLLGMGGTLYAVGQSIWAYYELVSQVENPFPSWADVFYIAGQLGLTSGIFVLFGTMAYVGRLRLMLDSAIAVSSVAIVSWYLLIQHLWRQSDTGLLAKIVGVSYPLMDILALYGAVVLLVGTLTNRQSRQCILMLVTGIVLFAFADSAYTYYSLHDAYRSGSWPDAGWAFGYLLTANAIRLQIAPLAAKVLSSPRPVSSLALTFTVLLRMAAPYVVAMTTGLSIILYEYRTHGAVSASVLGWIGALAALVVARQMLTLIENWRLTQQVSSLLEFTKSLNDSLDVAEVIAIAIGAIRRFIPVDGIVVWVRQSEEENQYRRRADDADQLQLPLCSVQWGLDDDLPWVRSLIDKPLIDKPLMAANDHDVTAVTSADAAGRIRLEIPLLRHNEAVGAIALVRQSRSFSLAELRLLESLAAEIGTVVTNALSYQDAIAAADRDPVTALFNHRAIHQRLHSEWEKAARKGSGLTVIMMDMNNFKFFNDTYGHPAGDQVIQMVSVVLQEVCRGKDVLGRYGGDEFVAILPDTDSQGGIRVAERLRERFAQDGYHAADGKIIPVTLSFGLASYPEDTEHRHELIAMADANLYKAKLNKEKVGVTSAARRQERELRDDESYVFLEGLVFAVDNKDSYTRRHSEDVTDYALWIGEEMNLAPDEMQTLRVGGLLHDVGKIGVPDHILRKPGALDDDEFELVKRHPELGAVIVAGVPAMQPIVGIVRSHHERWDGRGYPHRLCGEEIPLLARIVAVADAFSAMTTARPYRNAMPMEKALVIIGENIGTQFDPQAAEAFLRAFPKHQGIHNNQLQLHAA